MKPRANHNRSLLQHRVQIKTDTSAYPIIIGEGLLEACRDMLKSYPRLFLVTNDTLFDLYHEGFIEPLENEIPYLSHMAIPDGEKYKNIETLNTIYEQMSSQGLGRDGCVVALGGGVVGDMAGFAAATFMRGIDYVQIPTTLLAMVDSSIGGKTGINLSKGKNMVGSFHHPKTVFCDLSFLNTLPKREFFAGMMEVIKYGLILDADFYRFISENREKIAHRDRAVVTHLVYRSCRLKAQVVGRDEKEGGVRAILNFGHTVGHAIESYTNYRTYLHGEAVALGSLAVIRHLVAQKVLDNHVLEDLVGMLDFFGLPTSLPADVDADVILTHMGYDKKRASGVLKWITLDRAGSAVWGESVGMEAIRDMLRGLQKRG